MKQIKFAVLLLPFLVVAVFAREMLRAVIAAYRFEQFMARLPLWAWERLDKARAAQIERNYWAARGDDRPLLDHYKKSWWGLGPWKRID